MPNTIIRTFTDGLPPLTNNHLTFAFILENGDGQNSISTFMCMVISLVVIDFMNIFIHISSLTGIFLSIKLRGTM